MIALSGNREVSKSVWAYPNTGGALASPIVEMVSVTVVDTQASSGGGTGPIDE